MIRLPEIAARDEMREVTHRRDEAIRERRHVPHARRIRGVGHRIRLRIIHGERLFAKHVLAGGDGGVRDRRPERVEVTPMPVSRLAFSSVAGFVSQSATTRVSAQSASPGR